MADSSSSSDSSASGSDYSYFEGAIEGELDEEEVELFLGIQPWRFGLRGAMKILFRRRKISNLLAAAAMWTAKNGECLGFLDMFISAA